MLFLSVVVTETELSCETTQLCNKRRREKLISPFVPVASRLVLSEKSQVITLELKSRPIETRRTEASFSPTGTSALLHTPYVSERHELVLSSHGAHGL